MLLLIYPRPAVSRHRNNLLIGQEENFKRFDSRAREGSACSGISYRKLKNKDPNVLGETKSCETPTNGLWGTKDTLDGARFSYRAGVGIEWKVRE